MCAEEAKADGLLWVQKNSGVHNIFYVIQGYIVRPSLKKKEKTARVFKSPLMGTHRGLPPS